MDVVRSRWPSTPDAAGSPAADSPAAGLACRAVAGPVELATHLRIRRAVFVDEQGMFVGGDTDAHDDDAATVHVLGLDGGAPAGTVRLYPLGDGVWKGDRLAVLPEHRHSGGLGALLVRYAVATAGALGGERMVAQIQLGNVRFFRALGWSKDGEPADYLGLPHQQMSIPLR
jgi:putative N-acetyltransferase (TIGR04045 family)